jgi:SAM-dependent methyltransferase
MESDCIYDHPLYYDILFGWDRSKEADFYEATFARCGVDRREPILEIACGTGRVALLLAERGWRVTGLDLRPAMLAFLRERAAERGLAVDTLLGDMTSFVTHRRFAAAYNPLSSHRLLQTEDAARAHLRALAAALAPGAIHVLDMEFAADSQSEPVTTDAPWEMVRGSITVRATNDSVRVRDGEREHALAWGRESHLRPYTVDSFRAQIDAVGVFAVESWHPERTRATGVSEFDPTPAREAPAAGRTMVVLRSGRR